MSLRCTDCGHEPPGKAEDLPHLYECVEDGTRFTRTTSHDGESHRCPDCARFAGRIGVACPACQDGEVKKT